MTRAPAHRRAAQGLARTFQITNLFPDLTVLENCLLAIQAQTPTRFAMLRPAATFSDLQARARATLDSVGLAGSRRGSGAEPLPRRAAPARDRAGPRPGRPRLLLLDEPTAGLSPAESRLMADLLRGSTPLITVLHDRARHGHRARAADRVTVLHYGRVIADGPRDEVRRDPQVQEIYLGA